MGSAWRSAKEAICRLRVHLPPSAFGELQDELINMTTAGYMGERSPDRADAAIWALSELAGPEKTAYLIKFAD